MSTPQRHVVGEEVKFHAFLALALDGRQSLTSHASRCNPGEEHQEVHSGLGC